MDALAGSGIKASVMTYRCLLKELYPSSPHPVDLTDRRRSFSLTNNNLNLGQGWYQSFRT